LLHYIYLFGSYRDGTIYSLKIGNVEFNSLQEICFFETSVLGATNSPNNNDHNPQDDFDHIRPDVDPIQTYVILIFY